MKKNQYEMRVFLNKFIFRIYTPLRNEQQQQQEKKWNYYNDKEYEKKLTFHAHTITIIYRLIRELNKKKTIIKESITE